jgi:hypothetical protein
MKGFARDYFNRSIHILSPMKSGQQKIRVDLTRTSQYLEAGLGHLPLADNSLGEAPGRITSRHVQNMLQDGNASTILTEHIFVMNEIRYECPPSK